MPGVFGDLGTWTHGCSSSDCSSIDSAHLSAKTEDDSMDAPGRSGSGGGVSGAALQELVQCEPKQAGVKRKLIEASLASREELGEEEPLTVPAATAGDDGAGTASTFSEYYDPVRLNLENILRAFRGGPLHDRDDIALIVQSAEESMKDLRKALLVRPCVGLPSVAKVVDLLQSELLDKQGCSQYSCANGPCEWVVHMTGLLNKWTELDDAERSEVLEEEATDMEDHCFSLEFLLESLHDILEEELSNKAEAKEQIDSLLQSRLQASLAAGR